MASTSAWLLTFSLSMIAAQVQSHDESGLYVPEDFVDLDRLLNITGTATAYGSGVFQVTCPFNNTLYSCGVGNIQLSYADANRYAVPVSSTTCQCKETKGATCIAYCGNVKPSGYEIKNTTFTGNGTSACSAGKKVMSCGVAPTSNGIDLFRKAYPAANGQSCQCSYNFGAICFAVCADAPPNHEIVSVAGAGIVDVNCPDTKQLLGCGFKASANTTADGFAAQYVIRPRTCHCYNKSGVTCFAACGN